MNERRKVFEARIAEGKDSALLRFGLGRIVLDDGDAAAAVQHFARAVELNPDYAAAWAQLGRAAAESGKPDEAADAYRSGIAVAERVGEIQAARQMRVFLKRLEKQGRAD